MKNKIKLPASEPIDRQRRRPVSSLWCAGGDGNEQCVHAAHDGYSGRIENRKKEQPEGPQSDQSVCKMPPGQRDGMKERFQLMLRGRLTSVPQHSEQSGFIQNRHVQIFRLIEFRAGIFASQQIVCFRADRAGHFSAGLFNPRLCFLAL